MTARAFAQLFEDILRSLHRQGFKFIYVLNGHGANLAPMRSAVTIFILISMTERQKSSCEAGGIILP
ncbi:MAG: hypothetical protein CM1200mP18_20080 [Gammaproteobacteria bacterium]|nr:MAG: hypothetical protein CM1200mP18_20080 [Gammaproteobacteria bacterium]